MPEETMLKFYADEKCKRPLDTIQWTKGVFEIELISGEKVINLVKGGSVVTGTIFVRNETRNRFGITKISYPDSRVKIILGDVWLKPFKPVKITVKFGVPKELSPKSNIKAGKLKLEGYFIVEIER